MLPSGAPLIAGQRRLAARQRPLVPPDGFSNRHPSVREGWNADRKGRRSDSEGKSAKPGRALRVSEGRSRGPEGSRRSVKGAPGDPEGSAPQSVRSANGLLRGGVERSCESRPAPTLTAPPATDTFPLHENPDRRHPRRAFSLTESTTAGGKGRIVPWREKCPLSRWPRALCLEGTFNRGRLDHAGPGSPR